MQPSIQQLNQPIFSGVWAEAQSRTEQSITFCLVLLALSHPVNVSDGI